MLIEREIVGAVLNELNNFTGFDRWWSNVDDEVQDSIVSDLVSAVLKVTSANKK